jgi:hypothetical protein
MTTRSRNHRMGALSLPDVSFQTDIAGRRWVYDEHHRQRLVVELAGVRLRRFGL